jgi:hypothetical protein
MRQQSYVSFELAEVIEVLDLDFEVEATEVTFYEDCELTPFGKIESIVRVIRAYFRGHELTRLPLESLPANPTVEDIKQILALNLNVVSTDYVGDADGFAMMQDEYMRVIAGAIRMHSSTTNLCARLAVCYTNQGALQEEMDTVTLLIPDRDRENQDDFIWCIPIERKKWNKWYELSQKFKTVVPKEHGGGVRYMNRMEGRNVKTILMMPAQDQTDEDAVTACAYLRMVKGHTCRMYIVRCTDDPLTGARLIAKCAGANVNYVEEVEFTDEGCTTDKET